MAVSAPMIPPSLDDLPAPVRDEPFATLYGLWRAAWRPGRLPSRDDFDPTHLPPQLLSQLFLFDCVAAETGWRFRFRVAGTSYRSLIGVEATGRFFDEIAPPDRVHQIQAALVEITTTGRPLYLASKLTFKNREFTAARRLGLPLARDGVTVDMVLAIFTAIPRPPEESLGDDLPDFEREERYLL